MNAKGLIAFIPLYVTGIVQKIDFFSADFFMLVHVYFFDLNKAKDLRTRLESGSVRIYCKG